MNIIDYQKWNRKEHFEFFSKYDNPFFGVATVINCTESFLQCKKNGTSFFANYLHKSLLAANNVDALRYRILEKEIVDVNVIHAGTTIGRSDGTFGFSFIKYTDNLKEFSHALKKEIEVVENSSGLRADRNAMRLDLIHYSTLPWIKFTGLTHARNYQSSDSVPKITFGKASEKDGKWLLPISIEAHHGLVDGVHIARFLEEFQQYMSERKMN